MAATDLRTPTLFLLALGAATMGATLSLAAHAENSIGYQTYRYTEADGRMQVRASDLSLDKDFGTDYSGRLDIGIDAISGATPCWKPQEGYVNQYQSGKCKVADEVRNSVGAGLTVRDALRNEYTFGLASSREPDFVSNEISANAQFWHDAQHNRSYTFGLGLQDNQAIATEHTNNRQDRASKAWSMQFGLNQVLDRSSTLEGSLYFGRDSGYLSNHYLKIVRDDGTGRNLLLDEERPWRRNSGGVAVRWIKSWREDFKSNAWYRYYSDNWGISSHTLELKAYWDIHPQWRLNPVVRLFQQKRADFYRAYGDAQNTFASIGPGSNDARLGDIKASTVQLNLEYKASKEWAFNLGLVHYRQDSGLHASWVTAGMVLSY